MELTGGLARGRWLYELQAATELVVDYLDPHLCSVPGVEASHGELPADFIATPRLRLSINGVLHELICTDPRVLERHYARPRHQEVAYSPRPDRWTDAYHHARIRQARRLLVGVTGRVCDVGSGHSLVAMAGPWAFDLCACDRDAEAINELRARGIDGRTGPAEEPPFEPGTFDAVFAGEIVEHLAEPRKALRRWVELLRPGGRLIVTTPNRRHLLTRVRGHELVENPEHLFEWNLGELSEAVVGAGGQPQSVEGLVLPLPVYVPGRGWRDLGLALVQRGHLPAPVGVRLIELGRLAPALAADLAIVARRVA
ncbi:MAG: class I SAM-dependent methyltransferase [Candidatus Dormibacteria bacterium]